MNSYAMNSYIWIHILSLNSYIWIHIIWIHSQVSYMNSYHMNSIYCIHIWIHYTMNSYHNIHIWMHNIWILYMNSMYEFVVGYRTTVVRNSFRHRSCKWSAQALGLQTAWKCTHSHSWCQCQPWNAGSWYFHVLIFQIGSQSAQGETRLDAFCSLNQSPAAGSSINKGIKLPTGWYYE